MLVKIAFYSLATGISAFLLSLLVCKRFMTSKLTWAKLFKVNYRAKLYVISTFIAVMSLLVFVGVAAIIYLAKSL